MNPNRCLSDPIGEGLSELTKLFVLISGVINPRLSTLASVWPDTVPHNTGTQRQPPAAQSGSFRLHRASGAEYLVAGVSRDVPVDPRAKHPLLVFVLDPF